MNSWVPEVEPESDVVRKPISTGVSSAQVDPRLLETMMEPTFYPNSCHSVEALQTLTSWLFFAGDFVYKVKKPVNFSYIDARTPAKRYRLCQEEVLLNQRLAAGVYVGVAGIRARSEEYILVPNASLSVTRLREFAVVMHRLPRERMLTQMLDSQTLGFDDIQQLAEKLAAFHLNCSIAKSKVWGSVPALSQLMAATVAEAEALIADTVMRNRLATAARYLRGFAITHQPLLDKRARGGRVRDGHGDLRADLVCFVPHAPEIIGCVEYSEGLRYCDVASELASVMLDLEMAGRNDLADALVQAYIRAGNDAELASLIPFYKCYRALRRGQQEMLTSFQTEMPRERRMLARNYASGWFQLAERVAAAGA